MRTMRALWRGIGSGVAVPLAAGVVAGLVVSRIGGDGAAAAPGAAAPGAGAPRAAATAAAHPRVPYDLDTHCGIYQASIHGHWYLAAPPLSDGQGNPPAGWGNPDQRGTMILVSPAEAIFTDQAGHRVVFRAAPATGGGYPRRVCS